jgi:hypothetical protein
LVAVQTVWRRVTVCHLRVVVLPGAGAHELRILACCIAAAGMQAGSIAKRLMAMQSEGGLWEREGAAASMLHPARGSCVASLLCGPRKIQARLAPAWRPLPPGTNVRRRRDWHECQERPSRLAFTPESCAEQLYAIEQPRASPLARSQLSARINMLSLRASHLAGSRPVTGEPAGRCRSMPRPPSTDAQPTLLRPTHRSRTAAVRYQVAQQGRAAVSQVRDPHPLTPQHQWRPAPALAPGWHTHQPLP